MKVLIDARLYGLENAGLGRYLVNLVSELIRINDPSFSFVVILRKNYFDKLKLPNNFKKVCIDLRHYSFAEQLFLPIFLYKEKPDLVHFPHFNVPIFYFGRYIVTIHDMLMHKFKGVSSTTLPLFLYAFKRFFYYVVFRRAVTGSSLIIVPTNSVADDLIGSFNIDKSKIRVIYEGVSNSFLRNFYSLSYLRKKYNLSQNYIIYCGNIYPHKNLDLVLRSIDILAKKGVNNFDFLVVSPSSKFRKSLELQVKRLNLERRVRFLDFVSDRDLASLMHYSLAYVFPSLSEGFGLPGLEALSVGTILLASDIPVFREVYRQSPLYFNPNDPEDLAQVLLKVLKMKKGERERRIKSSRGIVNNYSWEEMVKLVFSFYKEVLYASS